MYSRDVSSVKAEKGIADGLLLSRPRRLTRVLIRSLWAIVAPSFLVGVELLGQENIVVGEPKIWP